MVSFIDIKHNKADLVGRLLTARPFERALPGTFLYAPYSRKLRRTVVLNGKRKYDLFLHLETNTSVAGFNERPLSSHFVVGPAATVDSAPDAVSVRADMALAVHLMQRAHDLWLEQVAEWKQWCELHEATLEIWTPERMYANRVLLRNQAQLLAYVSHPSHVPNALIESAIAEELGTVRKRTFGAVLRTDSRWDRTSVDAELARLILDGKIHSDIDRRPLDVLTELTIHVSSD